MTLSEIVPNSSRSSGSRNAMMSAEIASEMTVTTRYSCFAASQARLLSRAPSSCATTTAPPVASAAKMLIMSTFIISTSETPDTAASPHEETMMVSARPTVMASTCSSTSGQMSFLSAELGNSCFSVVNTPSFL